MGDDDREYPVLEIETTVDLNEMDAVGKTYWDELPLTADNLAEALADQLDADTARDMLQQTYETQRSQEQQQRRQ